jgi:hypothetical protein
MTTGTSNVKIPKTQWFSGDIYPEQNINTVKDNSK